MNLKIIQKIINGRSKKELNSEIRKIITDSKEIGVGDLFLTINTGHLYIEDAIKNGAIAIITDVKDLNYDIPIIEVENTKRALKNLASYCRNQFKGKIIAITGSNGKTTTKEILKHILSKKYNVLATASSQNNILGVSKTLLQLDNSYDYLILEFGMNHLGEISELSNLVKPDVGIITNIGTAHIGFLGSRENIFKAKMEILDGNSNMKLFVNGEDEYLKNIDAEQVLNLKEYENVNSCSAALAHSVSKYLGYNEQEIDELINNFIGVESRMQKYLIKEHIVIDDAYNASYESFVYGLDKLQHFKQRKIVIFGDMLELGSFSAYYHQKVLDKIKELDDKIIITVGQETSDLNNCYHFFTLDLLQEFLLNFSWKSDDVIYLKASHKLNLSSLISFFYDLW